MLFFFLRVGSILKTAGASRHYSLHIRERMFRSPLVLTCLASETCARVLKANWKLFPGTTPHSMPFDTWIIFLKFWRNLAFPPSSVLFWCWAASGFPTLLPVREKKPQKCSKAKFVHRAAIPSQKPEVLSCQQWVQGSEWGPRMSSPAACWRSPPLHQQTSHRGTTGHLSNDWKSHKRGAHWQIQHSYPTHWYSHLTVGFSNLGMKVWFWNAYNGY